MQSCRPASFFLRMPSFRCQLNLCQLLMHCQKYGILIQLPSSEIEYLRLLLRVSCLRQQDFPVLLLLRPKKWCIESSVTNLHLPSLFYPEMQLQTDLQCHKESLCRHLRLPQPAFFHPTCCQPAMRLP